jgi:hypothetical protein
MPTNAQKNKPHLNNMLAAWLVGLGRTPTTKSHTLPTLKNPQLQAVGNQCTFYRILQQKWLNIGHPKFKPKSDLFFNEKRLNSSLKMQNHKNQQKITSKPTKTPQFQPKSNQQDARSSYLTTKRATFKCLVFLKAFLSRLLNHITKSKFIGLFALKHFHSCQSKMLCEIPLMIVVIHEPY